MESLKAKVKKQDSFIWVSGSTPQQLVDNAFAAKKHIDRTISAKDYILRYMSLYKNESTVAKNTLIGYNCYLKRHILPPIGYKNLTDISVDDVQHYINSKADTLSKKTIKEHITLLAEIFDSAVEDGLINANPFRSKRLRLHGKDSVHVLAYTENEFVLLERALALLSGSELLYAALVLYCGMRRGEICALTWDDIDLDHGYINVNKSVSWPSQNKGIIKSPKTSHGYRRIVIIPQLNYVFFSQNSREGYLVRGRRGKENEPISLQGLQRLIERINKAVNEVCPGLTLGNRKGRHTVATLMNNAGIDSKTVEQELGHHSASFTLQRYVNAQDKQVKLGMEKLSAYMSSIID